MTVYAFLPPFPRTIPPFLPDASYMEKRFWGHYNVRRAGVNVFLLTSGDYCQTIPSPTPTDMTVSTPPTTWEPSTALKNANVPYPWNPTYPNDPYVHIQNWTGSTTTVTLTPRIVKVYWGGHINIIDQAEHDSLTAAGYTYCLRVALPTEIPPGWNPTST